MRSESPPLLILLLLLLPGASCVPPKIALDGKKCDAQGHCAAGYACAAGLCVLAGSPGTPCHKPGDCKAPLTCQAGICTQACVAPACECKPGDTRPCGSNVGECRQGKETCSADQRWGTACVGEIGPKPEICDGRDNDCDGVIDNVGEDGGFDCIPGSADGGICNDTRLSCLAPGTWVCNAACTWVCEGIEVCDGLDNDCNGVADNGFACVQGATDGGPCLLGCGARGTMTCAHDCSGYVCIAPEICNGKDDNCNGQVDEGFDCVQGAADGGACQTACEADGGRSGTMTCAQDCSGYACVPPAELCNGVDDDCDGVIDNVGEDGGFACMQGAADGGRCTFVNSAIGCSTTGTYTCKSDCSGYACAAPPEVCNGIDDNCNGQIDEGLTVGGAWQVTNAGDGGPSAQMPSIAALPSGAISVFADSRTGVSQAWAQRLDAQMKPTGTVVAVDASANPQTSPVVASTTSGFAVAWIEQSQVWLRRFDAMGTPQGAPAAMSSPSASALALSAFAAPGTDQVHLAWEDNRSGASVIYYNSATGTVAGAERLAIAGPPPAHNPVVAANPDAGTVGIAYEEADAPTQVKLAVLDSLFNATSTQMTADGGSGNAPTIAPSGSGYAVAWQDNVGASTSPNPTDIAIRVPGSAVPRYVSNANGRSEAPHLVAGPVGWFAIAWQDDRSGAWVIHMARLDAGGATGSELSMTSSTTPQVAPWVAYTGASFAVTWLGDSSVSPSAAHVYAQLLCP